MVSDVRRSDEPHDRHTRICNDMIEVLENHPENDPDELRCIIILDDPVRGGMVLHGFEDDTDAAACMFANLTALFRTMGKDLKIVPVGRG